MSAIQAPTEDKLFDRAKAGDQDAWRELFDECYPKICRAVRFKLDAKIRRFVDSTDIASHVFADLAKKAENFGFMSKHEVRAFLIGAAHQRVMDEYRHHTAGKRDLGRERGLTAPGQSNIFELSSGEPTPSQVAVADEVGVQIDGITMDDEERRIIAMKIENYTPQEVSEAVGWSLRRVQRFLEKLRQTILN